jgi:hypothetical protein
VAKTKRFEALTQAVPGEDFHRKNLMEAGTSQRYPMRAPSYIYAGRSSPLTSNTPARFPSPVHENTFFKSFRFLRRDKAYILVPKEHEYVAKTTMNEKPLKRK